MSCRIVLWFACVSVSVAVNTQLNYAVVLTTIPSRMNTIKETILSWFNQDIEPATVYVIVPKRYARFESHLQLLSDEYHNSPRDIICNILNKTFSHEMEVGLLVAIELDFDYGPMSKYVGLYHAVFGKVDLYSAKNVAEATGIDYFIIGDDDVHYSRVLAGRYAAYIRNTGADMRDITVYTHFAHTVRVMYNYTRRVDATALLGDADPSPGMDTWISSLESVVHLQGVDTVCIPTSLLMQQEHSLRPLSYYMLTLLARYFHTVCPASFYQDDYLMALLVHLAGGRVLSLWQPHIQVVDHIDGVSKSHHQMHMDADRVHGHESLTKECIRQYANRVHDLLYLCEREFDKCDQVKRRLFGIPATVPEESL